MGTAPFKEAPRRTELLGLVPHIAKTLRQAIIGLVAVAFGAGQVGGKAWLVIIVGVVAVSITLAASFVRWWRTIYRVGADDIRLETGLLSREARSVPYERIQDVSISEPLLARLLGLATVTFETGAGGKDEMTLAYVTKAEGERLRNVVRRQNATPSAQPAEHGAPLPEGGTLVDMPVEEPPRVLFAMDLRRLLTFGMFEFSLVLLAVIGAALQQLDFLLPFDIWDVDFWDRQLELGGGALESLGFAAQIIAIVLAVVSLLLLGVVSGLVRTVLRDYGFVLERTSRGFRRQRGLLNRTDVVMPVHRVQAAVLGTGLVRRMFGWHGLTFVSLANDAKSASHDVAPFARRAEIDPVASEAHIHLPGPDVEWQRLSAKPWIDKFVVGALALGIAAIVISLYEPALFWLPLLLLPVVAFGQYLGWYRHGWAMEGGHVYVKKGLLAPTIIAAPARLLQSVEIAQSLLGRLRGYAALRFGLAGGNLAIEGLARSTAQIIRENVLDEIARVDFSRLNRAR